MRNILYFIFYFIFNYMIHINMPYICGINIISFVHALITSYNSNYLFINDTHTFLNITKYKSNELNQLYQTIPIFTLCYSIFHLHDVLKLKSDFIIHGILLLSTSLFCQIFDKNHCLAVCLIIESSTIFMHLSRAFSYFYLKILFVITFILYRGILFPCITYNHFYNKYNKIVNIEFEETIILILALSFNILNMYWLKIIFERIIYKKYD
jgi:hypothetical protein